MKQVRYTLRLIFMACAKRVEAQVWSCLIAMARAETLSLSINTCAGVNHLDAV